MVLYAVLRIRIRDLMHFWPLDPGSGSNPRWKKIRIIFPRAYKQFAGLKILQFFNADPKLGSGCENRNPHSGIFLALDPGGINSNPGGIWDKHLGSATLCTVHVNVEGKKRTRDVSYWRTNRDVSYGRTNRGVSYGRTNRDVSYGRTYRDVSYWRTNRDVSYWRTNRDVSYGRKYRDVSYGRTNRDVSHGRTY